MQTGGALNLYFERDGVTGYLQRSVAGLRTMSAGRGTPRYLLEKTVQTR